MTVRDLEGGPSSDIYNLSDEDGLIISDEDNKEIKVVGELQERDTDRDVEI